MRQITMRQATMRQITTIAGTLALLLAVPVACKKTQPDVVAIADRAPSTSTVPSVSSVLPIHSASVAKKRPVPMPSASASGAPVVAAEYVNGLTWIGSRLAFSFGSKIVFLDPAGPPIELSPKHGPITRFFASSKTLAVATEDGIVSLYDISIVPLGSRAAPSAPLAPIGILPVKFDGLADITFSADETKIAVLDTHIRLFELATGYKQLYDIKLDYPDANGLVVLHEDGRHVLTLQMVTVLTFDWATGKEDGPGISTGTALTANTAISPDGKFVAAGADAGHTAQLWRTLPPRPAGSFGTAPDCGNHISVGFFKGMFVANAGHAWEKHVDLATFATIRMYRPKATTEWATMTRDGKLAVIREAGDIVKIVDPTTNVVKTTVSEPIANYTLRPDAEFIAGEPVLAAGGTNGVSIYSAKTGAVVTHWNK